MIFSSVSKSLPGDQDEKTNSSNGNICAEEDRYRSEGNKLEGDIFFLKKEHLMNILVKNHTNHSETSSKRGSVKNGSFLISLIPILSIILVQPKRKKSESLDLDPNNKNRSKSLYRYSISKENPYIIPDSKMK